MPGSLYLYQGEELGLPEVFDIPDDRREDPVFLLTHGEGIGRDGCRIPLPWTADPATSFGFSTRGARHGTVDEPWLPQPGDWGRYAASTPAARRHDARPVPPAQRGTTAASPCPPASTPRSSNSVTDWSASAGMHCSS